MKLDMNNLSEEVVLLGDIRAMKYSLDGTPLWNDPEQDGVLLYDPGDESMREELAICDDGAGGAFVHWRLYDQWFLQRISQSGEVLWNPPAELPSSSYWALYGLAADGSGHAFASWYNNVGYYLQKYDGAGNAVWELPTLIVAEANFDRLLGSVTADGVGGAMVCWYDFRDYPQDAIYGQRIDSNGQPVWNSAGLPLTVGSDVRNAVVAQSRSANAVDGLLLAWRARPATLWDRVHAQKVTLGGEVLWSGDELCPPDDPDTDQSSARIASDLQGGSVVGWFDNAFSPNATVRLTRVNAQGDRPWNGCAVTLVGPGGISSLYGMFVGVGGNDNVHALWSVRGRDDGIMWAAARDFDTGQAEAEPQRLDDQNVGTTSNPAHLNLAPGRTVTVWEDSRDYSLGRNAYFKMLDENGNSSNPPYGEELVDLDGGRDVDLWGAPLCSDGAGGFFCAFRVVSTAGVYEVRITRRTADGTRVGPSAGTIVDEPFVDQMAPYCAPDGAGGAFVAWGGFDENFMLDTWLQRVNDQCVPIWPEAVRFSQDLNSDDEMIGIVPAENGSCIALYRTGNWPDYQVRAVRATAAGNLLWDVAVGPVGLYYNETVIPDGVGGAVFGMRTEDETDFSKVRVQRLNADGELAWPLDGLHVDSTSIHQIYPDLAIDEHQNVFIAYTTWTTTGEAMRVQKVTPDGELAWGAAGLTLAESEYGVYDPSIAAVNSQNIYVAWAEPENGISRLKLVHLDADAELAPDPYWTDLSGADVCGLPGIQMEPRLMPDGLGGVVASWTEHLWTSTEFSIAAQRFFDPIPVSAEESLPVPSEFALAQNYPNPFNPETVIEFSLPSPAEAKLIVYDITGREVATLVRGPLAAGAHQTRFDAAAFASGVYFYRLTAGEFVQARKMVLVK